MFSNRRLCSNKEIENLKEYLSNTPVVGLVSVINQGWKVSKIKEITFENIGNLKTIWRNLDGIFCHRIYKGNNFLVSQSMEVLQSKKCDDSATLETIKSYIELLGKGQLEMIITILENKDEKIIQDGNKRSVAYYEYLKDKKEINIKYSPYVITAP